MKTIAICISELLKLAVILLFIGIVSATLTSLVSLDDGQETRTFTNQLSGETYERTQREWGD